MERGVQGRFTPDTVEKALDQARRATSRMPDDARCSRALGAALYRGGKFEEALAALNKSEEQRAKSGSAPSATGWAFMAMTQFKLGKTDEAKASLARLRDLMTSGPYAKQPEGLAFLQEAESLIEKK